MGCSTTNSGAVSYHRAGSLPRRNGAILRKGSIHSAVGPMKADATIIPNTEAGRNRFDQIFFFQSGSEVAPPAWPTHADGAWADRADPQWGDHFRLFHRRMTIGAAGSRIKPNRNSAVTGHVARSFVVSAAASTVSARSSSSSPTGSSDDSSGNGASGQDGSTTQFSGAMQLRRMIVQPTPGKMHAPAARPQPAFVLPHASVSEHVSSWHGPPPSEQARPAGPQQI